MWSKRVQVERGPGVWKQAPERAPGSPNDEECWKMRTVVCSAMVAWLMLLGGVGCKKSSSERLASAKASSTKKRGRVVPPEPVVASQPVLFAKKSKLPKKLRKRIAALSTLLKKIKHSYSLAYDRGGIKSWTAYYKAKKGTDRAQRELARLAPSIKKYDPVLSRQLVRSIKSVSLAIKRKSHPQAVGRHTFAILQAVFHLNPSEKDAMLNDYRATIKKVEQQLVAERSLGKYRVGLMVLPVKEYHRLSEENKRDVIATIKPSKRDNMTIGVFLRHAGNGMPLAGTDISVELIDAKSKQQLSTKLLHLVWDGYPLYLRHMSLPPKDRKVFVQVTISGFPLSRTQFGYDLLRSRGLLRFPAMIKDGQLTFAKRKAQPNPIQGMDLIRAMSLVGGQTSVGGPYRVGVSLVPLQTLYKWEGGKLKRVRHLRRATCQLIAFVQDRRSGLLIPNARLEAFFYYRNKKGDLFRQRRVLTPYYDGFPSYRSDMEVKPGYFDLRLRVDPPLVGRFQKKSPATYTTHFKGLQHPALAKRFFRNKKKR